MRIPSQLNRDSLYRQKNLRRNAVESYRRIFRLCLGLVLVLLVMKQAAQPQVYQVFFAPTQSANSPNVDGDKIPAHPPQTRFHGENDPKAGKQVHLTPGGTPIANLQSGNQQPAAKDFPGIPQSDLRFAERLANSLRPSDQQLWLIALLNWQTGQPNESVPSSIEILREGIAEISEQPEIQTSQWQRALDTLFTETPLPIKDPPDGRSSVNDQTVSNVGNLAKDLPEQLELSNAEISKRLAFFLALENAATDRVVDGSVWRSGDFDGLYCFISQASLAPNTNVPAVGVLPLLQQPDIYRNQWVVVSGEIARIQKIEAAANAYQLSEYWQLWIKPTDGANRPIVAIIPKLPKTLEPLVDRSSVDEGTELTICGRYLKRLSYQSGIGADLAPVVVGKIREVPQQNSPTASPQSIDSRQNTSQLRYAIAIAIAFGLVAAGIIMWNTSISAKRARKLRQSAYCDQLKLPS